MPTSIKRQTTIETAIIAASGSLSSAVHPGGMVISAIQMPAAWVTAALTFQASVDGVTFSDVYDDAGTEVTVAASVAAAGRFLVNKAILEQLAGCTHIKIRSGVSATPVVQTAEAVLTMVLKG